MRKLQDILEFVIVWSFYQLMGLLPPAVASNFGGWLGRQLGPHIKRTQLADKMMAERLPHMTSEQRARALREMWDHLGRTLAEYPHLARGALDARLTIEGREHAEAARTSGEATLFFTGHIGNWEMLPKSTDLCGIRCHVVYRPPNNPLIDRMIDKVRMSYSLGHYSKGKEGARGSLRAISKGESLVILVDQKDNEGALLPFMGAPAMTMTSAAKLALKYRLRIIPCRAIRNKLDHRMIYYPPIALPEGDEDAAVLELTQRFNDIVGEWVKERPGQWFWLHRRWPKKA
jgi:KDO2-lipid IV(A) lauroyltransferase